MVTEGCQLVPIATVPWRPKSSDLQSPFQGAMKFSTCLCLPENTLLVPGSDTNVWGYATALWCPEDTGHNGPPHPLLFTLSTLFSTMVPEPWGREV